MRLRLIVILALLLAGLFSTVGPAGGAWPNLTAQTTREEYVIWQSDGTKAVTGKARGYVSTTDSTDTGNQAQLTFNAAGGCSCWVWPDTMRNGNKLRSARFDLYWNDSLIVSSLYVEGNRAAAGSVDDTSTAANSVSTTDIKNLAVTAAKIDSGVVAGYHVEDGSLTGADVSTTSTFRIDSLFVTGHTQIGDALGDTLRVYGQLKAIGLTNDLTGSLLDVYRRVQVGPNLGVYGDTLFMGASSDLIIRRGAMDSASVFQYPTNEGVQAYVLHTDGHGNTHWDQITSDGLADSSATTEKVKSNAITAPKIAADAVGRQELGIDAVGSDELDMGEFINGMRLRPFQFDDMTQAASSVWKGTAISSGSTAVDTGESSHPGIHAMATSASSNSGYSWATTSGSHLEMAGGECFETSIYVAVTTNLVVRIGFADSWNSTAPTDGAWIQIDGTTLTGKTDEGSSSVSTTGTSYTISTDTWYRARVVTNADASRVDFYLYNDAGSQLWTNYLTGTIPGTGDFVGHGMSAYTTSGTNTTVVYLDYLAMWYDGRSLTR